MSEPVKIVLEGRPEWSVEDGGCALVGRLEDEHPRVFVNIHSWSTFSVGRDVYPGDHPEADALKGRLVRVTIETVEEVTA